MEKIRINDSDLRMIIKEAINDGLQKNREMKNCAKRGNFLNECYSETTYNRCDMVSLNETNAKRLINRHSKDGYVIISPCRGASDFGLDPRNPQDRQKANRINSERFKEFINILKQTDFSYTPTYGSFLENAGEDDEELAFERSAVVYNHHKDGSVGDFQELYEFAIEMAKRYNQDSVLIKAPNETPKYIKKNGDIDLDFSGDVAFNDMQRMYFTDLHKNTHKKGDISGRKPTRFTFVESYINPAPQCYGERYKRYRNGEIFYSM